MNKLSKHSLVFCIVLILAAVLRLAPVSAPPSLNWDETSLGYNAYSILKTGKDEWGRMFPISFEAFGDYKLPGYIYTLVPFIAILGLNEFATRLPSAIAGILSVLFLYLLVKKLTNQVSWALLSMALLAISPWHIFLSRIALEANLALFLFILGLYFFALGLKKSSFIIFSAICFGLTIFTYNSARVFIPLFILSLFVIFKDELVKFEFKSLIFSSILFIFISTAAVLAIFQDSSSRYFWVAIVDQGAINHLNESRASAELPTFITNLVYNRYSYFLQHFTLNYLSHFSTEFLNLKGGTNYQFSLPNSGLMYIFEFPFLIFGLVKLFNRKKTSLIFLLWLFLAPVSSAITREAPHALRSIFMLGVLQILVGLGIYNFLELIKKYRFRFSRVIYVSIPLFFIVGLVFFLYQYYVLYPQKYSQSWQYGSKQISLYIDKNKDKYQKVFITKKYGEPHIFYLFYNQYNPGKYQNNPTLVRYEKTNWRWVDGFDNLVFLNDWEVVEKVKLEKNALLITTPNNFPEGSQILESVYFLDGDKAFDIVSL